MCFCLSLLWPVNCLVSPDVHVKSCLCLSETPWTRWRMCMRRIHRWETPAACSPKYQRRYVTWRSCAQKSTKMRYEFVELYRFIQLLDLSLCGSCRCQKTLLSHCVSLSLSVDRLGYLRWRESRAPEETEDTALTTTITLLKAERGIWLHTANKISAEKHVRGKYVNIFV